MKKKLQIVIILFFLTYLFIYRHDFESIVVSLSYTSKHSMFTKYTQEDYKKIKQLFIAIRNEDRNEINQLLNSKMEVNCPSSHDRESEQTTNTPLSYACFFSDYQTTKRLLDLGAIVDGLSYTTTPLREVFSEYNENDLEMVKLLVNNGANIKKFDYLYLAADLNVREKNEKTNHQVKLIFQFLEKHGSIFNSDKLPEGYIYLTIAASNNNLELLKYLVEKKGIAMNSKEGNTWSALMGASESNSLRCAKYLLINGANKEVKDQFGNTALSLARSDEMRELLSKY